MATFQDVIFAIPGLTHYYPLTDETEARDLVGTQHGTVNGNVEFTANGAVFDGSSDISLGDSNDFSAAGTASKAISILVFQTVTDWTKKSANNEYVHWMGKGKSGAHEWTFRYYIDGGGGEAPERKRRTSYYNFNPDGGLGTGSYFQDEGDGNGVERVITGLAWGNAGNGGKTQMWKNGELRDTDNLSDYDVYPQNTGTPVFLGSRGDGTGNLVGKLRRVAFFNRQLTEAEIKSLYDARSYAEGAGSSGGGDGGDGGDGGGGTPPPTTETPTEVIVGGESFALSGVDVARAGNSLVAYTKAYGSATDTNEWGAEVKVVRGVVAQVLDQQAVPAGEHNMTLTDGGYVLSGHGEARTFLLANATIGARAGFTELELPDTTPPPSGGGGCDLTVVEESYAAVVSQVAVLEAKLVATEVALSEALEAKGAVDSALSSLGNAINAVE